MTKQFARSFLKSQIIGRIVISELLRTVNVLPDFSVAKSFIYVFIYSALVITEYGFTILTLLEPLVDFYQQ